jgi:hypothetical protein
MTLHLSLRGDLHRVELLKEVANEKVFRKSEPRRPTLRRAQHHEQATRSRAAASFGARARRPAPFQKERAAAAR